MYFVHTNDTDLATISFVQGTANSQHITKSRVKVVDL